MSIEQEVITNALSNPLILPLKNYSAIFVCKGLSSIPHPPPLSPNGIRASELIAMHLSDVLWFLKDPNLVTKNNYQRKEYF